MSRRPTAAPPAFLASSSIDGVWPAAYNAVGEIVGARTVRLTPKAGGVFAAGALRVDLYRGTPFGSDASTPDFVGTLATVNATIDTVAGSPSINVTSISGPVAPGDFIQASTIPAGVSIASAPAGGGPGTYTLNTGTGVTAGTAVAATIPRTESLIEAAFLSKMLHGTDGLDNGAGLMATPVMGNGIAATQAANYTTIMYPENSAGVTVTLTRAQLETLRVKDNGERAVGVGAEAVTLRWERKAGDLTGRPIDGINVLVTVAA